MNIFSTKISGIALVFLAVSLSSIGAHGGFRAPSINTSNLCKKIDIPYSDGVAHVGNIQTPLCIPLNGRTISQIRETDYVSFCKQYCGQEYVLQTDVSYANFLSDCKGEKVSVLHLSCERQ